MLKYLKSTSGTAAINLDSVAVLISNLTSLNNVVTLANTAASTSSTTGTIIVTGGAGIGGNLNVAGNIGGNNLTVNSAKINAGLNVIGQLNSTNIVNSGSISASSGTIGILNSITAAVSGQGTFGTIQVGNLANVGSITAITGTIGTLTSTSVSATNIIASASIYATDLYVDNAHPRNGNQINFGNADKVRITGGVVGQVLGTDGNGNLTWIDGPGQLTVGTGLVRVGNTISLAGTGFQAGTYDRITIDQYGRAVNGISITQTLDTVVGRGATTGTAIQLTNATDSTDPGEGALIVTGGVGVGATLVANELRSKGATNVEGSLNALSSVQVTNTLFLNGVNSGVVPLKITSGSLIPGSTVGSVEFDGDYLYVTTSIGRQVVQLRDSNAPASPVALVRAVASRNITISAATQSTNDIDNWDEVTLNAYDRVLLTSQTNPAQNGVYVWNGSGAALTRALDFNAMTGIFSGTTIFVGEGQVNHGSMWQIETANPITVGSTAIDIYRHLSRDNIAIAQLPVGGASGLITRTQYGTVELRSLKSNSSWITVANADGKLGNITISTGTVPVTSGGTGRTSITGWMRGTGASIMSTTTIPLSDIAGAGSIASQNANNVSISGGTISVASVTATALTATTTQLSGTTTANVVTAAEITVANLMVTGPISVPGLNGNVIALGANSTGTLSSAAITVTPVSNVTDTIALMNVILGKLVPPSPPNFPNSQAVSISSLTTARMANFTQTDNTTVSGYNAAGGTVLTNIRRLNSYQTNNITGSGPGDTGTVRVYKNGVISGTATMSGGVNGTYSDLVIFNNQDYHNINAEVNPNFWYSFDARASGTVSAGWNDLYINHTASASTNTVSWYYDASSPGTPVLSNTMITNDIEVLAYSSTVPHYTSASRFDITFDVNKLSGDTYPTSDSFATGIAGGAFATPVTLTYAGAGITVPLARNLYASAGSVNCTTTATIIPGFGSSIIGPTVSVTNGYASGSHVFTPGATILYKTGTSNQIEETSIPVTSVGTGSGNAQRIINPGATDTPAFTASAAAFNSETTILGVSDATVVAAVLKHDQVNYSSGYLPIGPNLSVGRSGSQYFTVKLTRTVVSKFNIKYTGTLAGLWVALPGSIIDTSSTLNGWLSLSSAYNGAGVPGAGTGGNGSNGCAIGGVAVLNSAQTNKQVTATFGTVSSSSTATNEIYIRIKLTAGQSLTAISIEAATN